MNTTQLAAIIGAIALASFEPHPAVAVTPQADAEKPAALPPETAVTITVNEQGFAPSAVEVEAGQRLALTFIRTSDKGCGDEVVFPDLGIRRKLPLNKHVTVRLTPKKDEVIAFTCGMGMYRGKVVVVRQRQ
jgi:plastocyanin domain-containing protein